MKMTSLTRLVGRRGGQMGAEVVEVEARGRESGETGAAAAELVDSRRLAGHAAEVY